MRKPQDVLIRPVVTEKALRLMEEDKYTFYVDRHANKIEIKDAVQQQFKVDVEKVTTMAVRGKQRRMGRFTGKTPDRKKAVVKLKAGNKIELFENL